MQKHISLQNVMEWEIRIENVRSWLDGCSFSWSLDGSVDLCNRPTLRVNLEGGGSSWVHVRGAERHLQTKVGENAEVSSGVAQTYVSPPCTCVKRVFYRHVSDQHASLVILTQLFSPTVSKETR